MTHLRPGSLLSALARTLRVAAAILKSLFGKRRPDRIDTDHASAHVLRDVGMLSTRTERPIVSLGQIW